MKKVRPYIPGIILFLLALIIGILVYQDYGMAWDEPIQRDTGVFNYNYVFHNNPDLFTAGADHHGAAFELTLLELEQWMNITDSRDLYLMRHLVSHLLFLISAFFGYVLVFRLFRNRFIACLGFIMLAFAPRMYAHSFFNSKDIPFLSMTIIVFALCQVAFSKNKNIYFILLGIAAGYAAGIRVMGIMFAAIILLFLFIDVVTDLINKKRPVKPIIHALSFIIAFCLSLYISWPFLWRTPVHNFIESFNALSRFDWDGSVFFEGKALSAKKIPWTYFPVWFLISNPPVWLVAGFAGIIWVAFKFFRQPISFITNTANRNFLLYLLCFIVPVLAVILLHSVIYDDWRHLYFVYPPFVLLALYCINSLVNSRFKPVIIAACAVQVGFTGYFMVRNHPFQQVYFNSFVSHSPEYLRKNYDMEYWGCSYKQALDHLLAGQHSGTISIEWDMNPLQNNIMMLPKRDRDRIARIDHGGDYRITNFRLHPDDFPYSNVVYSVKVLNSTIVCVYKTH